MAFVFKIHRAGKASAKWYVRYRDPKTRRIVTRAGYADKLATEQLAARLVREAARHAEGMGPPAAVQKGGDALDKLREQFRQVRLDKERTPKHVNLTDQRLRDLFAGCGWTAARDLNADAAMRWLAERRKMEGHKPGKGKQRLRFGLASTNHYLRAVRAFSAWLAKRTHGVDAFAGMELLNAEADVRVVRAALTLKELAVFFKSVANSEKICQRLTGPQRSALYQTAAMAGLRASELARLTPGDLTFGKAPEIRVSAKQKKRRETILPMHKALVPVLREQCQGKAADELLWPGKWIHKSVRMLHRDLRAAGIVLPARGKVDLHALRVAFVTNLGRAGVDIRITKDLARHSDIRLTTGIYSRFSGEDLAKGLDKLR